MSIKLISDGTSPGTRVEMDGKVVPGVVGIRWELEAGVRQRARVYLELREVEVEIEQQPRRGGGET